MSINEIGISIELVSEGNRPRMTQMQATQIFTDLELITQNREFSPIKICENLAKRSYEHL